MFLILLKAKSNLQTQIDKLIQKKNRYEQKRTFLFEIEGINTIL